jgi:hypothetical protein
MVWNARGSGAIEERDRGGTGCHWQNCRAVSQVLLAGSVSFFFMQNEFDSSLFVMSNKIEE